MNPTKERLINIDFYFSYGKGVFCGDFKLK